MTESFDATTDLLDDRKAQYRALHGEVVLLSLLAIAQQARDAYPTATHLALDDSDQEGCWKVSAELYTADGREVPDPDLSGVDSLCDNLSDAARAVWEPFTGKVNGRTCLDLAAALRIAPDQGAA